MVPWTRVRWLPVSASRDAVLAQVSQERFSRWPVVETPSGRSVGYLLTKDLIAHAASSDWKALVRPLKVIRPDDSIEMVLMRMQDEGDSVYVVEDESRPVGLVTLEDILEQVVGQIEDEYPHEPPVSLVDAVANGGIALDLAARNRTEAIRELAMLVPVGALPPGTERDLVARCAVEREERVSTDLGNGVAIPHARCPDIAMPVVVLGRSEGGLVFSPSAPEPVRLVFLLITPSEQPEAQLALLRQLAGICREKSGRDALMRASSAGEVVSVLGSLSRDSA
jgi:mannitol/fructose-specific phosphotransferase system IIA component (Ntr-type)